MIDLPLLLAFVAAATLLTLTPAWTLPSCCVPPLPRAGARR